MEDAESGARADYSGRSYLREATLTDITVTLKNGAQHEFRDPQQTYWRRGAGKPCTTIRYEGGWAIIEDHDGAAVAFPAQDVAEIRSRAS